MAGRGYDSVAVKTVKKFEQEVHTIVTRLWPKLVAHELAKLARTKPKTKSKSKSKTKRKRYRWETPLSAALERHGSKRAAAKALGMAETTFRDRLKLEISHE